MPIPDLPDLAGAAERLRGWLDDLAAAGDGPGGDGLAAWHQSHGAHLIAAALALEELAAGRLGGTGRGGHPVTNMPRLEAVALALPEAERVDVEAWGGEPTFRVRGRSFVFTDPDATGVSVKLPKEEAAAVVASDPDAEPTGYGLGRHGWVSVGIGSDVSDERWAELVEMVRTSYTLVAPKTLARRVLAEDTAG